MEAFLLSRSDAAIALGLGRRTIDELISSGKLRARRIGRRVLIPRTELERFASPQPEQTSLSSSLLVGGGQ
jgi:excisionase family DNA binding protein